LKALKASFDRGTHRGLEAPRDLLLERLLDEVARLSETFRMTLP